MHKIGVIQGRLSVPIGSRIQAFPRETWREEFGIAKQLGLSSIEWIVESPLPENPLMYAGGIKEIQELIYKTGVTVDWILADYFMEAPFVRMTPQNLESNRAILLAMIDNASQIGAKGIEIPCVDASEIRNSDEEKELIAALTPILDVAAAKGIQLGIESSLGPKAFRELLVAFNHPIIFANYDIGNSASLGYQPTEEFAEYANFIRNVHVKDRIRGGSTVPLGTGSANLPKVIGELIQRGYQGDFILQGARGPSGLEAQTVTNYISLVKSYIVSDQHSYGPSA